MRDLIPVFDYQSHPLLKQTFKDQALNCPHCGVGTGRLVAFSEPPDLPALRHRLRRMPLSGAVRQEPPRRGEKMEQPAGLWRLFWNAGPDRLAACRCRYGRLRVP